MDYPESDSLSGGTIWLNLACNCWTAPYFNGVYSLDTLPRQRIMKLPQSLVVNTAYAKSDGEHWVCMFMTLNSIIYFDPLGLPPDHQYFHTFLQTNGSDGTNYNNMCLQSVDSETCGKFVTTFLYYASIGKTLNQYLNIFRQSKYTPDDVVRVIYDKLFQSTEKCGGQTCHAINTGSD